MRCGLFLEQRHCFFPDLLNKIVSIVHHGLIRPHDGARILHTCASIVGLPLLKEVPNTIVTVEGLIKSNDAARVQQLLFETFSPFGDIVDASIAPVCRVGMEMTLTNTKTTCWNI